MTTFTLSIPDSLKTFIDDETRVKGYENSSEYIRSLLCEAQNRNADAQLEALLLEGLEKGGEDVPITPEFWRILQADSEKLLAHNREDKQEQLGK